MGLPIDVHLYYNKGQAYRMRRIEERADMIGKKAVRAIKAFLLFVILFCLVKIGQSLYQSKQHERQQETLKEMVTEGEAAFGTGESVERRQENLKRLAKINTDLVGWLEVEGTRIDGPVMQHEDDEYYLYHNFYGAKDHYGCLYVRNAVDIEALGTNFIIYGHNMRDGSMFGELEKYKKEAFFDKHKEILFDTLLERQTYEVMAAFESSVTSDPSEFRYYQFYQADTKEEFDEFYHAVKKLALYDTSVTAEFGDAFMTLSTCDYSEENGRFVVVAKRKKT